MPEETIPLNEKTRDFGILPPDIRHTEIAMTFHIPEFNTSIPLYRFKEIVVLGRIDPTMPDFPDVDFSPYRAYERGVSRNHAAVHFTGETLQVQDLGSVNGTYVNGQRLSSGHQRPLKDGDELRLGKLVLRVGIPR